MALLDDLEGILGKDAIDKIKADPRVSQRAIKADELLGYYDGDEPTAPPAKVEPKVEPVKVTSPGMDMAALLAGIDKSLDAKLGTIGKTIDDKIDAAVKTRGAELAGNASSIALRNADELNRVYRRHEKDFGEDFDSTAFNTFVEDQKKNGRGFKSVTEAYEAMTADKRTDKTVEDRVREQLKTRASAQNVPGVTPPSVKSPLGVFMARGKAEGGADTAVSKAAAMLAARRASHANAE